MLQAKRTEYGKRLLTVLFHLNTIKKKTQKYLNILKENGLM